MCDSVAIDAPSGRLRVAPSFWRGTPWYKGGDTRGAFMSHLHRVAVAGFAGLVAVAMMARPASAQSFLNGDWVGVFHEDQPERGPGPALGDYLGIPINAAGRQYADSWDASRLTLPEHQCRAHVSPYIYRGPIRVRITEEIDPGTQNVIAIKHFLSTYAQERTIWLDGREHPLEEAPHTWMGFSTGEWQGSVLKVRTTHLKQGWHRRNGIPMSAKTTMTEYFYRHDDVLTQLTIANVCSVGQETISPVRAVQGCSGRRACRASGSSAPRHARS